MANQKSVEDYMLSVNALEVVILYTLIHLHQPPYVVAEAFEVAMSDVVKMLDEYNLYRNDYRFEVMYLMNRITSAKAAYDLYIRLKGFYGQPS